jgi:Ca2+ transporting ATPase
MASYELLILLGILYAGDSLFLIKEGAGVDKDIVPSIQYTMVFNTFVYLQVFNEINARRLDNGNLVNTVCNLEFRRVECL